MSIGFGIFLSFVFFSLAMLYINSKNQRKWIDFFKKSLKVLLILISIGILILTINEVKEKYFDKNNLDRPNIQESFQGVNLGDSLNDAIFILGDLHEIPFSKELINRNITKWYDAMYYTKTEVEMLKSMDNTIRIKIKNKKVVGIDKLCGTSFDKLNGIYCGETSDNIFKDFSKNEFFISCEPDNAKIRFLFLEKYRTYYMMFSNSVVMIGTYSKELDERPKELFLPCN